MPSGDGRRYVPIEFGNHPRVNTEEYADVRTVGFFSTAGCWFFGKIPEKGICRGNYRGKFPTIGTLLEGAKSRKPPVGNHPGSFPPKDFTKGGTTYLEGFEVTLYLGSHLPLTKT